MSKNNVVHLHEDSWDELLEGYEEYIGSDKSEPLENGYKSSKKKEDTAERELEEVK